MQHSESRTRSANQESARDYPLPPRVESDSRRVTVRFNGATIADSTATCRVLQQGLAPVFYIPPEDVRVEYLRATEQQTHCPYKGDAHYYDVVVGDQTAESAAWCYPEPKEGFGEIQYALAYYPEKIGACEVDGEEVRGDDAGGWITGEITGIRSDT